LKYWYGSRAKGLRRVDFVLPIRSRAGKWEIAQNIPINDLIRSKSMRRSLNWRKKNRSSAI
jgi:hypothetical protein